MKHSNEIDESIAFFNVEDKVLYEMIDVLNDAMVMMRFSVNTSVHLEVVIVKLIEVLSKRSNVVEAPEVDLTHIEQKLNELERRLEHAQLSPQPNNGRRTETKRPGGKGYSVSQIEKVLDKANKEDIVKLKDGWPQVYQYVEEKNFHALRSLIKDSEPVAASDTHVLIKFDSDVHSELINTDDKKKQELEAIIPTIIGKEVQVVGVPQSSWQQVRADYIKERKSEKSQPATNEKKPSDVAKELFDSSIVETRE